MASAKEKPVCFIAMAFEHEDTDYLYEKQILPILRRNGIKPIIINRQQSNDDLNIQIIEQLQGADFCITDLTYARQSVYFEAGYAQRKIPVIYTVRKDHLNSGQPDNLRVHFDLQMKPLIVWKSKDDLGFSGKLEKRIKSTFLINWNRSQAIKAKSKEETDKFNKLSLSERLFAIRRSAIKHLQKLGFSSSTWSSYNQFFNPDGRYGLSTIRNGLFNYINAHKISNSKATFVSIQSFHSLTKKDIYEYNRNYYPSIRVTYALLTKAQKLNRGYIKVINKYHVFMSIKTISVDQFASVFSEFRPLQKPFRFYQEYSDVFQSGDRVTQIKSTFFFLDGIKSEIELNEQLNLVTKQIEKNIE